MISLLHAGCGKTPLPAFLSECKEVRLDIDPELEPDIVASMTDLGEIGPFEMIWCCHSLEHLFPHDALTTLKEFRRVLTENGCALIIVPDLEGIKPTFDVIYESEAGPITGHDMFYGHRAWTNPHMQHKFAYMKETLEVILKEAGFSRIEVRREGGYQLFAMAYK